MVVSLVNHPFLGTRIYEKLHTWGKNHPWTYRYINYLSIRPFQEQTLSGPGGEYHPTIINPGGDVQVPRRPVGMRLLNVQVDAADAIVRVPLRRHAFRRDLQDQVGSEGMDHGMRVPQ